MRLAEIPRASEDRGGIPRTRRGRTLAPQLDLSDSRPSCSQASRVSPNGGWRRETPIGAYLEARGDMGRAHMEGEVGILLRIRTTAPQEDIGRPKEK